MTIERISTEDQKQMSITGKTKLHWNANDELIWISYEYAGEEYRQAVTDTDYTGGTAWGDITRTKTFAELDKQ